MKKYFYTFPDNPYRSVEHGLVEITEDRYINGCPIEDYGDYLLSDVPLEHPHQQWLLKKDLGYALSHLDDAGAHLALVEDYTNNEKSLKFEMLLTRIKKYCQTLKEQIELSMNEEAINDIRI
jgi:hypothetical protein